LVCMSCS
jgi:hypothetical protein